MKRFSYLLAISCLVCAAGAIAMENAVSTQGVASNSVNPTSSSSAVPAASLEEMQRMMMTLFAQNQQLMQAQLALMERFESRRTQESLIESEHRRRPSKETSQPMSAKVQEECALTLLIGTIYAHNDDVVKKLRLMEDKFNKLIDGLAGFPERTIIQGAHLRLQPIRAIANTNLETLSRYYSVNNPEESTTGATNIGTQETRPSIGDRDQLTEICCQAKADLNNLKTQLDAFYNDLKKEGLGREIYYLGKENIYYFCRHKRADRPASTVLSKEKRRENKKSYAEIIRMLPQLIINNFHMQCAIDFEFKRWQAERMLDEIVLRNRPGRDNEHLLSRDIKFFVRVMERLPDDLVKKVLGQHKWANDIAVALKRDDVIMNHIFIGPPGTGKTLTSLAIAQLAGIPCFVIDIPLLLNEYKNSVEAGISAAIKPICDEARRHGMKCLIVLDEMDTNDRHADGQKKDYAAGKTLGTLIVNNNNNPFVSMIGTANYKEVIPEIINDRSFIRMFEMPTLEDRKQALEHYLTQVPEFCHKKVIVHQDCLHNSYLDYLASHTNNFSHRRLQSLVAMSKLQAYKRLGLGENAYRCAFQLGCEMTEQPVVRIVKQDLELALQEEKKQKDILRESWFSREHPGYEKAWNYVILPLINTGINLAIAGANYNLAQEQLSLSREQLANQQEDARKHQERYDKEQTRIDYDRSWKGSFMNNFIGFVTNPAAVIAAGSSLTTTAVAVAGPIAVKGAFVAAATNPVVGAVVGIGALGAIGYKYCKS